MSDILLYLLSPLAPGLLYALLGVYFWRAHAVHLAKAPARHAVTADQWAILLAIVSHGASLYAALFRSGGMHFSFSLALSLMLWLAVFIYWLESFRSHMQGLEPIILLMACTCTVLPFFFPHVRTLSTAGTWGFKLHFLTAMLAYSLFTLSALHAVLMAVAEKKLHQGALNPGMANYPPLLVMESLLFRIIKTGFIFLTLALLSGLLSSETLFGRPLRLDHKNLFSFSAWGIFAALLVGRRCYGWRGRVALRWTLTGFLLLLLAYIGSRFVLEALLGRI